MQIDKCSHSESTKYDTFLNWWWVALPFLLAIAIVPCIVYLRIVPLDAVQYQHWIGTSVEWDFYTFYKARWLIFLALAGFVMHIHSGPSSLRTWFAIPIFAYGFFAIVSTFLSDYVWQALSGAPGRSEGLFVHLAYVWLALAGMSFAYHSEKFLLWLTVSLAIASSITGLIGTAQAFGLDPYRTYWWQWLILQYDFKYLAGQGKLATGCGHAFSTLGNSNYSGSFTAITWVFFSGLIFLKTGFKRFWLIPLQLLQFAFLFGSRSKAGMFGGVLGFLGIIILSLLHNRRKIFTPMAIVLSVSIFLLFAIDFVSMENPGEAGRLFDQFSSKRISHATYLPPDFETIEMATDTVKVIFRSTKIQIEWKDGFKFKNASGTEVPYNLTGYQAVFPKDEMFGFNIKIATETKIVKVVRDTFMAHFQYTDNGFRILDGRGRPFQLREVPRWGFEGRDRWGNGRGFIWARTFPLVWRSLFIGFGPDTFLYVFPNDDFIAKLKAGYGTGWIVDKPHNWYLQVAINIGGVALLLLLVMFLIYFAIAIPRLYKGPISNYREVFGASATMAIFAYLVAAFFNDSVVGVAPIFWALLGASIGNLHAMQSASSTAD